MNPNDKCICGHDYEQHHEGNPKQCLCADCKCSSFVLQLAPQLEASCCAMVLSQWRKGVGSTPKPCSRPGPKYLRDGKVYCGQHDPERITAREKRHADAMAAARMLLSPKPQEGQEGGVPFDPEAVKGYQPWIGAGIGDRIVTWDEWSALLALYRRQKEELSEAVKAKNDAQSLLVGANWRLRDSVPDGKYPNWFDDYARHLGRFVQP
jgi:hypothetical protein